MRIDFIMIAIGLITTALAVINVLSEPQLFWIPLITFGLTLIIIFDVINRNNGNNNGNVS
jgi:hypothetical protein